MVESNPIDFDTWIMLITEIENMEPVSWPLPICFYLKNFNIDIFGFDQCFMHSWGYHEKNRSLFLQCVSLFQHGWNIVLLFLNLCLFIYIFIYFCNLFYWYQGDWCNCWMQYLFSWLPLYKFAFLKFLKTLQNKGKKKRRKQDEQKILIAWIATQPDDPLDYTELCYLSFKFAVCFPEIPFLCIKFPFW